MLITETVEELCEQYLYHLFVQMTEERKSFICFYSVYAEKLLEVNFMFIGLYIVIYSYSKSN
jgi:hypothetical protein